MADEHTQVAGSDRLTKILLGVIAAGIWALVILQAVTARKIEGIAAEVAAIGADTEAIHQDIDPGEGEEEPEDHATSSRAPDSRTHRAPRRTDAIVATRR